MHSLLASAWAILTAAMVLAAGSAVLAVGPAERRLTVNGLAVTYLRPEGNDRVPLAVIIAGSGPTDRDGNSVQGLQTDAYKQLAQALSDLGIASVRYDKRGIGGSADLGKDETQLTIEHFAKDAQALAAWARQLPNVGPIVLIGHSEGGVLALMAAKPAAAKGVVCCQHRAGRLARSCAISWRVPGFRRSCARRHRKSSPPWNAVKRSRRCAPTSSRCSGRACSHSCVAGSKPIRPSCCAASTCRCW